MPGLRTETMTINMGPQHPSTHGVLRLVLELDGEIVRAMSPTIGYLHTGIEKTCEQKKWQQVIPLVERMDYLSAQSNSMAFSLSVERLLGLEIPQRVTDIRVLIAELQRINSHLVWLGTHGMEVGAVSVMLYCFREREQLLNLNEMLAGFRMFPSYMRVGGLREDLPRGFLAAVRTFLDAFPGKLDEYEDLLTRNSIYLPGFTVPAGEAYVPVEGPRGEHGFSIVSDGTNRPWRVKARAPSLMACQALEKMIVGGLIADVIAVIGSIDVVMGDVDR